MIQVNFAIAGCSRFQSRVQFAMIQVNFAIAGCSRLQSRWLVLSCLSCI